MLRDCCTCQMWLNVSSTFCTIEITVNTSSARPMPPSTPPRTFSTKAMTWSVISAPLSPSGARNSYSRGSICRCTPKPFNTEKLKASSGTTESRVV